MRREIGIDLGTTNSVVATIEDGRIRPAENREGNILTPSVVYFSEDEQATVGERALNLMIVRPTYCVSEVKRLMGDDVPAFIHPDTGQKYSPVEVSSLILKELKEAAELYYGEPVESAVITVPAYFNNEARQATGEAANLAGLKVLRIANEPSMALRAYMFSHQDIRGIYAVLDLGGGTMDISIAEVNDVESKILTSDGDRRLGGTDFTMTIEKRIVEEFKKQRMEFDPQEPTDAVFLQDIREKAERAKRELSKLDSATIAIMAKGTQIMMELSRDEFEDLTKPYVDRVREKCLSAIQRDAGEVSRLNGIVLVGGATRMPCIQQMIEELAEGVPVLKDVSQDTAVAMGAAIEAYALSGKPTQFLPIRKMTDVTMFDIGIAAHKLGDSDPDRMFVGCIIPKGTPLPASQSRRFGVASMSGGGAAAPELIVCEGTENQEYDERTMKVQSFPLTGISPGSDPEEPRIEVTITVDENGIITAEALDLETGQRIRCEIQKKAIQ